MFGLEFVDLFPAAAARHHWQVIDERVRYHRRDRFIGAVCPELRAQMRLPQIVQFLLIGS